MDLYNYKALVKSVYDGDTITVDIDLGLSVLVKDEKVRLNRINAPELKGDEKESGLRSRDFLRGKIDGKEIYMRTVQDKKEKYGRYLGEVFIDDLNGNLININDILVQEGFAVYKEY